MYSESLLDSSRNTGRSTMRNRLGEIVDNYSLLVCKQEKKIDWTQVAIVELFEQNVGHKNFKALNTGKDNIKIFIHDVSNFYKCALTKLCISIERIYLV